MKKIIIFLLLIISVKGMAQTSVLGGYYFSRQEMVAGFNFSADGKFEFFYSYGAVDRNATGTFLVHGDTLQLKSDKPTGKDFTIKTQTKQAKGYTLVFSDPNQYLLKDILCVFFVNGIKHEFYSDSKGKIYAGIPHCDTIYIQHPLYPDIFTLVKDKNNDNNSFMLTLNSSLAQVSFKGIDFKIESDKKITCSPNYFMGMEKIEFIKE